MSVSINHK